MIQNWQQMRLMCNQQTLTQNQSRLGLSYAHLLWILQGLRLCQFKVMSILLCTKSPFLYIGNFFRGLILVWETGRCQDTSSLLISKSQHKSLSCTPPISIFINKYIVLVMTIFVPATCTIVNENLIYSGHAHSLIQTLTFKLVYRHAIGRKETNISNKRNRVV